MGEYMALQERTIFIKDPRPGMTKQDKNIYLGAQLALAPLLDLSIVQIKRVESNAPGWSVVYLG